MGYKNFVNKIAALVLVFGLLIGSLLFFAEEGKIPQGRGEGPLVLLPLTASDSENVVKVMATVTVLSHGFSPNFLIIKPGTQVIWVNKSGSVASLDSIAHRGEDIYQYLSLGRLRDGESVSFVFEQKGIYKYHNHNELAQEATIVIE